MFKLKIQIEAELGASNLYDLMHLTVAVLNLQNFYFIFCQKFILGIEICIGMASLIEIG